MTHLLTLFSFIALFVSLISAEECDSTLLDYDFTPCINNFRKGIFHSSLLVKKLFFIGSQVTAQILFHL